MYIYIYTAENRCIPNYGRQAVVEDNILLKILMGRTLSKITISKLSQGSWYIYIYMHIYIYTVLARSIEHNFRFDVTRGRSVATPSTHHSFFREYSGQAQKTEEFRPAVRRNSSDAASKLRFFRCPFFGVVVGGLPGRVFKNSFYIFSRPRHALKPPLICLLLR